MGSEPTASPGASHDSDLRAYYENRHAGDYTAAPLEESTGLSLLLWRRIGWILDELNLSPSTVLEVGCGKGKWLPFWRERFSGCQLSGCDISENALKVARERGADAELRIITDAHLPFEDDRFDFVACIEVIEHVPDPGRLMCQIHRVLRPGGYLLITTPCANALSLDWFCAHLRPGGRIRTPFGVRWYMEDPSHLHRMKSKELRQLASEAGLQLQTYYYWRHYLARLDTILGPMVRQPGRRFSLIRRRLRWMGAVLDFFSNAEWSVCKHIPTGSNMIGVFRKGVA